MPIFSESRAQNRSRGAEREIDICSLSLFAPHQIWEPHLTARNRISCMRIASRATSDLAYASGARPLPLDLRSVARFCFFFFNSHPLSVFCILSNLFCSSGESTVRSTVRGEALMLSPSSRAASMSSTTAVNVFCGSGSGNDPAFLQAAEQMGHALARAGRELV